MLTHYFIFAMGGGLFLVFGISYLIATYISWVLISYERPSMHNPESGFGHIMYAALSSMVPLGRDKRVMQHNPSEYKQYYF